MTGTSTHVGGGVDVIARTSGSAYSEWLDVQEIVVRRCFHRAGVSHVPVG
ncbi:hypothetical protein [Streptomyces sp. NPDC005930]